MRLEDVIERPLITEKAAARAELANEYFFAVHRQATKTLVRHAVEKLFKVKVISVHTMTVPGKRRRFGRHIGKGSDWKKAIVKLKEKQKIELFEGK